MLPVEKLPIDYGGLTPEMREELENRIVEFENECEPTAREGGAGYVPIIKKKDFIIAGSLNALITIYLIIAVLIM